MHLGTSPDLHYYPTCVRKCDLLARTQKCTRNKKPKSDHLETI